MTWFNHLTFFHVSTLDPMVAEALLSIGKENLPNNTYYGDSAEVDRRHSTSFSPRTTPRP